jgi:hemolysin activation/secretion protein
MTSSNPSPSPRRILVSASFSRRSAALILLGLCCCFSGALRILAAPVAGSEIQYPGDAAETNAGPRFTVETYDVEGGPKLSMDAVFPILSKYTGTNVSLGQIAQAAAALQAECRKEGFPMESVAIATEQITNGVVTMNVFRAALPQVIISGVRYSSGTNAAELSAWSPPPRTIPPPPPRLAVTNAPPLMPPPFYPAKRATPEQLGVAAKRLSQEIATLAVEENDHRIHVPTNAPGQRFNVQHYLISGNSVLTPQTIAATLTNIDGAFGTNVSFDGVKAVVEQLREDYHDRGYKYVDVDVPKQTLANQTVKLQVLEGRLSGIDVAGNRYFSSNNVMASLPSLHTNRPLNVPLFNAELAQANRNQDRQIYPVIGPGPTPGSSQMTLTVKDRLPLHAKIDLDNQSSPGTPDLRVNASAVYDNFWQNENALGVQYGFSPELYKVKQVNAWQFYDQPRVAYYSAFYRMPLGPPESLESRINTSPGSFGYNEATRQFNVPPPTGQPELTVYGTRATIDTGGETLKDVTLLNIPQVREISQLEVQEGITINEDLGFRLSKPLAQTDTFRSVISGGLDFKEFAEENFQTNTFTFNEFFKNAGGTFVEKTSYVVIQTPTTSPKVDYLPLDLSYVASMNDFMGPAVFGLGLRANLWYKSYTTYSSPTNTPANIYGAKSLQSITGSSESTGYWVVLRPAFSQEIQFYTNWITTVRMAGQWASEPLISSEQFGAGGVNSVPGYHEGEIFGDEGWRVGLDQETAPLVVGTLYGGAPLQVRASIFTDYSRVYDINVPAGVPGSIPLWGTGFGFLASAGSHLQARFLFSWPLLSAGTISAYHPFFNFELTGQF